MSAVKSGKCSSLSSFFSLLLLVAPCRRRHEPGPRAQRSRLFSTFTRAYIYYKTHRRRRWGQRTGAEKEGRVGGRGREKAAAARETGGRRRAPPAARPRASSTDGGDDLRSAQEAFTAAGVALGAETPNVFSSAAAGAPGPPGKPSLSSEASGSEVLSRRATAAPRSGAAKSKGREMIPQ